MCEERVLQNPLKDSTLRPTDLEDALNLDQRPVCPLKVKAAPSVPSGELLEALHQAQRCIQQAEDGGWLDGSGRPLRVRARLTLCLIYNRLSEEQLDQGNHAEALELLQRSHHVATESKHTPTHTHTSAGGAPE